MSKPALLEWFKVPQATTPKERLPQWHAAEFTDGYRGLKALERIHALVLDVDGWEDLSTVDIANLAGRWSYLAHTTPSHRPGAARWRVVLPLARPIEAHEWEESKKGIASWISLKASSLRGRMHMWGESRKEQEGASGIDIVPASQAFYVPMDGGHYEVSSNITAEDIPLRHVVEAELEGLKWEAKRARKLAESEVLGAFTIPTGWLRKVPATRSWLLKNGEDGVLPLGKVGMLAAEGGAGKTMALVQLAVAVAAGAPDWLGWDVQTHGPVALLLGEEDHQEAQRRIYNAATAMRLTDSQRLRVESRLTVAPLAGVLCAWTQKDFEGKTTLTEAARDTLEHLRLMAEERGEGWALIVVDPLSRFAGSDAETDAAQATRFVQVVEKLTALPGLVEEVGPTVLLAHHTNKVSRSANRAGTTTDATAARGSSALTDGVRWQAQLERQYAEGSPLRGFARLSVSKSNYAKVPEPLELSRGLDGVLCLMSPEDRAKKDRLIEEAKCRKAREKEASKDRAKKAREARQEERYDL